MSKQHLHALGVLALCSAGCERPPESFPLTDDQKDEVVAHAEKIERTAPFMVALMKYSYEDYQFGKRKKEGIDEAEEDLYASLDDLWSFIERDRVYGFHGENFRDGTIAASIQRRILNFREYITIDVDGFEAITSSMLFHETGHLETFHHKKSLEDAILAFNAENEASYANDPDIIRLIADQQDFPYLLTVFGEFADVLLDSIESQVESRDLSDLSLEKERDIWLENETSRLTEMKAPAMDALGITEEELKESLRESKMFDYKKELYNERKRELGEKIRNDAPKPAKR